MNISITITDSVIRFNYNNERNDIDEETNTMITSSSMEFIIDRISASYNNTMKISHLLLDGSSNFFDLTFTAKGTCSPYDPNQPAF